MYSDNISRIIALPTYNLEPPPSPQSRPQLARTEMSVPLCKSVQSGAITFFTSYDIMGGRSKIL